jgi:hypothetical protein
MSFCLKPEDHSDINRGIELATWGANLDTIRY